VKVEEDWHDYGAEKELQTEWITMGKPRTGKYKITAKTINSDGTVEDSDTLYRSI